jgi:hypothetical protein
MVLRLERLFMSHHHWLLMRVACDDRLLPPLKVAQVPPPPPPPGLQVYELVKQDQEGPRPEHQDEWWWYLVGAAVSRTAVSARREGNTSVHHIPITLKCEPALTLCSCWQ